MKSFTYRIIEPCGGDRDQYKVLHNELFRSAGFDNAWGDWYHKQIPYADKRLSKTRTYGLFDEKRLIGIWSVEPKILRDINGNLVKVGRCFAVGVSPDYRRMGLFVLLSEYAIARERELGEYEYIVGFPQTGRSVIGGHLKAGWEEVKFLDIYSVDLATESGRFSRKDVRQVVDFDILPNYDSRSVSFDEPAEYRNVRFLQHPKLQYNVYSYGDAHIVLKSYSTWSHILEMQGSSDNLVVLLEATKSIAKQHGLSEINVWSSEDALYNDTIVSCGFKKGAEHGLPITVIAVRINAKQTMQIGTYNFGMGVEEGY